jgi:hypothetical protein
MVCMAIWALIRVVSLGYLLGLVTLTLAALCWHWLRPRLAPAVRADTGFTIITTAFVLNAATALYIYVGVVNAQITMTTNYFHRLMYGGWGLAISITGGTLLAGSLYLMWRNWRRGLVPRGAGVRHAGHEHHGLPLLENNGIPTICLVGVWRPELWINPEYWRQLTPAQRELALAHEGGHRRRRDNLRRLILQFVGGLYAVLPWLRGWAEEYAVDSEYAVDDACRRRLDPEQYVALVARATEYTLSWREAAVASHLSHSAQALRLKVLATPVARTPRGLALAASFGVALVSIAPATLLLLNPISRCLCACYLGY